MAKDKRKLLEEGDQALYIHDAVVWVSKYRPVTAIKISLSQGPRSKPATRLFLFDPSAKLWAVQLAEYCVKAGLPWPLFKTYVDVVKVLKALKRKRVLLRVRVGHRSMDGEAIFADCRLLRPGHG